jgi:hypothetical protein
VKIKLHKLTGHELAKWLLKQPDKPLYMEIAMTKGTYTLREDTNYIDGFVYPRMTPKGTRVLISNRSLEKEAAIKAAGARAPKKKKKEVDE